MRIRLNWICLFLLVATLSASACPGCKEAIKGQGGFWASGFNWSIVFMLGVFCTLLAAVCYKVYRIVQRETEAMSRDPEAVHASKGHWMTITLPVCGVGIAVLMTLGSVNAEPDVASSGTIYTSEQSVQSDIAKAHGDLLITFKSETCGICRQMKPAMENLAVAYESKVKMLYVNTSESKTLVSNFDVDDLPCSVLVHDGKEVARRAGLCSEAEFKTWLDERLK